MVHQGTQKAADDDAAKIADDNDQIEQRAKGIFPFAQVQIVDGMHNRVLKAAVDKDGSHRRAADFAEGNGLQPAAKPENGIGQRVPGVRQKGRGGNQRDLNKKGDPPPLGVMRLVMIVLGDDNANRKHQRRKQVLSDVGKIAFGKIKAKIEQVAALARGKDMAARYIRAGIQNPDAKRQQCPDPNGFNIFFPVLDHQIFQYGV